MSELVHIIHPSLSGTKSSIQVESAFKRVWEKRGWKIVSPEEAIAHDEALARGEAPISPARGKAAGGES